MSEVVTGLVSTIIPVYNRPEMLLEAVVSVLKQTYRPIEIIISDDGSTDATPKTIRELVEQYPDEIRSVRNKNQGAGQAREAGRLLARGEFIQYLDSDDLLAPTKFEVQVDALRRHPDCGVAYCITRLTLLDGTVLSSPYKRTGEEISSLFPILLYDRWWNTHSSLYRRSVCDQVGPWSTFRYSQDWEYDGRVGALGTKLIFCPQTLCDTRRHDDVRQTNSGNWLTPGEQVRFFTLMYDYAVQAGVDHDAAEMRHFSRWVFSAARKCGALGYEQEADACFRLAKEVAGKQRSRGMDFRVFDMFSSVCGWRFAGQSAQWFDRLYPFKRRKETLRLSWMSGYEKKQPRFGATMIENNRPVIGAVQSDVLAGVVSTIIPAYNRPEMLKTAVDSVLKQTYRVIEIIISDDGSNHETAQYIDELALEHPDIIRVVHNKNQGPGPAREAGRLLARGEFIQYLDSDDYLHPDKFTIQVAALRDNPECDVAYGITRLLNSEGKVLKSVNKWTGRKLEFLFPRLIMDRWWCTHTPLYRRSLCDKVGPWSNLRYSQDWEYDSRVGALGARLVFCNAVVSDHVEHDGQRQTGSGKWLAPKDQVRFFSLMLEHARQAGVKDIEPEMRHFSRWVFSAARQCGVLGYEQEADACFRLAKDAAGPERSKGMDFRVFEVLSSLCGWKFAGKSAQWFDKLNPVKRQKETLRLSWMPEVKE